MSTHGGGSRSAASIAERTRHYGSREPHSLYGDARRPFSDSQFAAATLTPFHGGVNSIYEAKITRADGSHITVAAKRADFPLAARQEIAAHEAARAVGLRGAITPMWTATRQGTTYVVTPWVANRRTLLRATPAESEHWWHDRTSQETRARMVLHAYLTGDADRGPQNYMWDPSRGRIVMHDFGAAWNYHGPAWHLDVSTLRYDAMESARDPRADYRNFPISSRVLSSILSGRSTRALMNAAHAAGPEAESDMRSRLDVLRRLAEQPHPDIGALRQLANA